MSWRRMRGDRDAAPSSMRARLDLLIGFTGPIVGSAALGPYFWFAAGVAAYWFGSGKRMSGARTQEAT